MPSLVTERIESVKAGIIGAGAFAIAEFAIVLLKVIVVHALPQYNLTYLNYLSVFLDWELLLQLAIGAISGFLFGVTYRYVIRDDLNSHLNDGAVLAFGLVRGLALVENRLILSEFLSLILLVVQSIICFAIARFILDLAISRKLIKLFV